jgi:hypothetical protein
MPFSKSTVHARLIHPLQWKTKPPLGCTARMEFNAYIPVFKTPIRQNALCLAKKYYKQPVNHAYKSLHINGITTISAKKSPLLLRGR